MDDLAYIYATAVVIIVYFLAQVLARRFDPLAPIWLFLVGYVQMYVIQPITCHPWAVEVRGKALVEEANGRVFWSLCWFLAAYHLFPCKSLARALPGPPRTWSRSWVMAVSPFLIIWGVICSLTGIGAGSSEGASVDGILHSFPLLLLIAGVMLIVTGKTGTNPRSGYYLAGLACSATYALIWMFNGKRSHSLMAVLSTMCAVYVARMRRPSWAVLFGTAFSGALVVGIAIGWRNDREHDRSLTGFAGFLADFEISRVLESLNIGDGDEEVDSYETWEYGGFLLMMDTVPGKSDYDYGACYLRTFSTFIPRIIWRDKPYYGRDAWVQAWIAGSEFEREDDFAGPSIGILGATQLNGGVLGTLIVLALVAVKIRTAYDYLLLYADVPWVQFFWASTFYNSWFMVVTDNPMIWFYFNWGVSGFPIMVLMWWVNRSGPEGTAVPIG